MNRGCIFELHVDTPVGASTFVGTLVVCLPVEGGLDGGQLVVYPRVEAATRGKMTRSLDAAIGEGLCASTDSTWGRADGERVWNWVAFYGDCPHAVLPVTRGTRVTLTFATRREEFSTRLCRIVAASHNAELDAASAPAPDVPDSVMTAAVGDGAKWNAVGPAVVAASRKWCAAVMPKLIDAIRPFVDARGIGLLAAHRYSVALIRPDGSPRAHLLKETDAWLYDALCTEFGPENVKIVSAVVYAAQQADSDGRWAPIVTKVVAITPQTFMERKLSRPAWAADSVSRGGIRFIAERPYYVCSRGQVSQLHHVDYDYVEYTGNSSQSGNYEGAYYKTAFVVLGGVKV